MDINISVSVSFGTPKKKRLATRKEHKGIEVNMDIFILMKKMGSNPEEPDRDKPIQAISLPKPDKARMSFEEFKQLGSMKKYVQLPLNFT